MKIAARSVRVRATLGATIVMAAALALAALALASTLHASQVDSIDNSLELRAIDIESLIDGGAAPASVAVESDEDGLVQIVDDSGNVIAASDNLAGEARVVTGVGESTTSTQIAALDNEQFRVHTHLTDGSRRVTIIVGTTLEDVERNQNALRGALAIGIPTLLAVVAALVWIVVGRALRPVEAIRSRVAGIGGNQLDQRVPVPASGDEINRLANTMNEMLERLEAAQARQARFVSDASHELRTPIAVIRHELEIALRTTGTEHWAAVGADVLDEDLRMERLVDDLLFIARHESERTDRATTGVLVDVDDVVLTETRRGAITKTVDITGVSAGQIRGKPDEIARVVRNLLDNALRHAGTTVAVYVTSSAGNVVIDVDDDGSGVPEADRDRVFERFARLDDSRTRSSGGSGLGLAIVGEIVADHHGTVTVNRSPSLGGARFTVTLPDARTITTP